MFISRLIVQQRGVSLAGKGWHVDTVLKVMDGDDDALAVIGGERRVGFNGKKGLLVIIEGQFVNDLSDDVVASVSEILVDL